MKTAKLRVYPYLRINEKGEVVNVVCQGSPGKDSISEYDGSFYVHLPMVEIEVSHPEDCRAACVELLRHTRKEKTAEHQQLLTKFQFAENQLLGLAAPEVLDKVDKPTTAKPVESCVICGHLRDHHEGQSHDFAFDDDIPF